MVGSSSDELSIADKCRIAGIAPSSYYYERREADAETLAIMAFIDKQYLRTPFYGSPRMTTELRKKGYNVNPKRVTRLMRVMNLQALYPKPNTSASLKDHTIYPYLLKGLKITHPNHVWSTDLTYIGMPRGWMYLMAVMDWYSRYVIHWDISNTMDVGFCTGVLEDSLRKTRPEIFNTDQGSQFTSNKFTSVLASHAIQISMDGKSRAIDNVLIERLWWSVKHEDIYLKNYETVGDLRSGLGEYFRFYNTERSHTKLDGRTPYAVYHGA